MYHLFLLFAIITSIKASSVCPYPDLTVCGDDGQTYRNKCEWNVATLLNPALKLSHVGPCNEYPSDELHRIVLKGNGNKDVLRARNKRLRNNKEERPWVINNVSRPHDVFQRLNDLLYRCGFIGNCNSKHG